MRDTSSSSVASQRSPFLVSTCPSTPATSGPVSCPSVHVSTAAYTNQVQATHQPGTDLSKKINPAHLNPDTLVGKYIPNLIAQPFDVSREYAQIIYDRT